MNEKCRLHWIACGIVFLVCLIVSKYCFACGLDDVLSRGELRHLGVPYAAFVTGSGDGLDVELAELFAQHLGVKYTYVETSWRDVIADLTGKIVRPEGSDISITGEAAVRGDMIANGLTILPWREKIVAYSEPTFVTQVWLLAAADSPVKPIISGVDPAGDIEATKTLLPGRSLIGVKDTCLDPSLYGLTYFGPKVRYYPGNLNELTPAVIRGDAEMTLLDMPDALIALDKWPGLIKILGPISEVQYMAFAFRKEDREFRKAFNKFFGGCKKDGTFLRLVRKYYPLVLEHFPDFFGLKL